MDHKTLVGFGVLLAASGCAPVIQQLEDAVWDLQKRLRAPGEASLALPADVWKEYRCSETRLPLFRIENRELIPPRLRPGQEFDHRLVYALCNGRDDAIQGSLRTRISYQGKVLVDDVNKSFSIKPGRWQVDTFIRLPPQAERGSYTLELEFASLDLAFTERSGFIVQ